MDELILMAPIQIKLKPHLGNIYDWLLIDFYSKALKMQDKSVLTPLIWNVFGHHVIKALEEKNLEINDETINELVNECVTEQQKYLQLFDIDFNPVYRDDNSTTDLEQLISDQFKDLLFESDYIGNYCPSCDRVLNNDPNITHCKRCNVEVDKRVFTDYFIKVNLGDQLKKAEKVSYYPESLKKRLIHIIKSFPEEYDLLLTKERLYTAMVNFDNKNISLDPRYATILMIPLLINRLTDEATNVTLIQGPVIKKLDYYLLCYSNGILPDRIVAHGVVLNEDGKKLRWDFGSESDLFNRIKDYSPSIIRGFLLSNGVNRDVKFLESRLIGIKRFKTKIDNVLHFLKINETSEREVLSLDVNEERAKILGLISDIEFKKAFHRFKQLVYRTSRDYCLRLRNEEKSSDVNLYNLISDISNLYFGGSDDWSLDSSTEDY